MGEIKGEEGGLFTVILGRFFPFWKGTKREFDFHLVRDLASLRKIATMLCDVLG